ncbi:MAG TPA: TolC family protein, partial [Thermoanaerobaculia bacterium]|nr:TolC family protein [Thermoanaerobaculia bacterium]
QRLAAMEAEAEARLAAAHSRRQALEDRVRAEVRQAALRVAEAGHIIELYRSRLAPASRDRVQAARVAFESSRVDFPALIDAERNLRTVELGLEQALTSYRQRLAELARLTGQPPGVVEERDLLDGVAALGGDLPFAPSAETPAAPPSLPGAAAAGDTP